MVRQRISWSMMFIQKVYLYASPGYSWGRTRPKLKFLREAAAGMQYLHENNIIHGGCKRPLWSYPAILLTHHHAQ